MSMVRDKRRDRHLYQGLGVSADSTLPHDSVPFRVNSDVKVFETPDKTGFEERHHCQYFVTVPLKGGIRVVVVSLPQRQEQISWSFDQNLR